MRGGDYMEENGVWRTVGGRRIFIKEGQDLASAMKESGKFPKSKKVLKTEQIRENIEKMLKENTELKKELEETQHQLNIKENEYLKTRSKYIKDNYPGVEKGTDEYKKIREEYDKKHKENYNIENQEIYSKYNNAIKEYQNYKEKNKSYYTQDDNIINWKNTYQEQIKKYLIKEANGYTEIADRMINSSANEYDKLKKFGTLAKENNFVISKSPYGSSMYAIPKGDVVEWGYKPMDSYRIADHWGFESQGKIHCKLGNSDEYITDLEIGKWNGKYYEKV